VVHVYSKGIPQSYISGLLTEPKYKHSLGYSVYGNDYHLWIKETEKLAVLVRHDGIHPNLFVWKNPYLNQTFDKQQRTPVGKGYPSILKFGSSFTELKSEIEENCDPLQIKKTDPWLLNSPKKQI